MRRNLTSLAALAAILLLATAPGGTQPADILTIKVGALVSDSAGEIFYADELGMFKRAGLDVQISAFSSGGAISAGVVAGAFDIGSAGSAVVAQAHLRGLPLYLIAPAGIYSSKSPTTSLVVPPGSPLRGPKDLAGKTVAVSTLRDLPQVSAMAWIDAGGGDSTKTSFIEMHMAEMLPAVQSGRVDAVLLAEPFLSQARGSVRVLGTTYDAVAKQFMVIGWISMQSWLEKNPVAAARFVAVMRQAGAWANANPQAAATIMAKRLELSEDLAKTMHHARYAPALSAELIQPILDASARYHTLPRTFPASELFYPGLRCPSIRTNAIRHGCVERLLQAWLVAR